MSEDWEFIPGSAMTMRAYKSGFAAGQRVRLRKQLAIRDHTGAPTGKVHQAGELWTVLAGNPREPDVVWLREPNGEAHTWDDDDMLTWFEAAQYL